MHMLRNTSENIIKAFGKSLLLAVVVVVAQTALPNLFAAVGVSNEALPVAFAREDAKDKPKQKTRRTPALRNKVYEKLAAAQAESEAGNIDNALKILKELETQTGKKELNSYEKANLYNFYAFIYYSKERYKEAAGAYEQVLKQPDIPEAMEINTQYSLAQLYFVMEDYPKAAKALEAWFDVAVNPAADAYVLLAQAYLQLKNYDRALELVEKAMEVAKTQNKEPKEQWYVLLRFLYSEKNNVPKQKEILETLVKKWPKKEYWVGLSAIYGEMNREMDQLHTLETAYVQGLLNREPELVSLAQMYAGSDMPYKAAKVMEAGFKKKIIKESSKNLERIGEYWRRAQETKKALPKLAAAADKAKDGEPYIRLAYIYFSLDRYKETVSAVTKGLKKGGVKRKDEARMLLGQALFYENKYDEARKTFQKIASAKYTGPKPDKNGKKSNAQLMYERQKKVARQWMDYMVREKQRKEEIAKYLQS